MMISNHHAETRPWWELECGAWAYAPLLLGGQGESMEQKKAVGMEDLTTPSLFHTHTASEVGGRSLYHQALLAERCLPTRTSLRCP